MHLAAPGRLQHVHLHFEQPDSACAARRRKQISLSRTVQTDDAASRWLACRLRRSAAPASQDAFPASSDEVRGREESSARVALQGRPDDSPAAGHSDASGSHDGADAQTLHATEARQAAEAIHLADSGKNVAGPQKTQTSEALQAAEAIYAELGGLGSGGEPVSLLSSIDGVLPDDLPVYDAADDAAQPPSSTDWSRVSGVQAPDRSQRQPAAQRAFLDRAPASRQHVASAPARAAPAGGTASSPRAPVVESTLQMRVSQAGGQRGSALQSDSPAQQSVSGSAGARPDDAAGKLELGAAARTITQLLRPDGGVHTALSAMARFVIKRCRFRVRILLAFSSIPYCHKNANGCAAWLPLCCLY